MDTTTGRFFPLGIARDGGSLLALESLFRRMRRRRIVNAVTLAHPASDAWNRG